MKTLTRSSFNFFTCKHSDKNTSFWCSTEICVSRQEIGFLRYQKLYFQHKEIHSVSSSSQTTVGNEQLQIIFPDQPETVRVRFKLQKECAFGQQFLIVGDDPIVGLWDPSSGVPLTWSEGHVWISEILDIEIGKVIKYKLILKDESGNVSWQPGHDRILEIWNTKNTITVVEDWDEEQNIMEMDSDSSIVGEKPIVDEEESEVMKTVVYDNGHTLRNNIVEFDEEDWSSSYDDQKKEERAPESDGSMLLSSNDDEGVPVLVPGLHPIPIPLQYECEGSTSTQPQLKDESERVDGSLDPTKTSEMNIDEKQQETEKVEINDVFKSDIQWGRRTLERFLANLGFQ